MKSIESDYTRLEFDSLFGCWDYIFQFTKLEHFVLIYKQVQRDKYIMFVAGVNTIDIDLKLDPIKDILLYKGKGKKFVKTLV